MIMKQTEKKCQNDIIKYYKAKGYQVLKTMGGFQGSYSTPEGGPDLIVFRKNGEVCLIEVKSETGKLRDSQIVKIYELCQLDHTVGIARPIEKKPYFEIHGQENNVFCDISEQEYKKAKANLEKAKAEKKALRDYTKFLKNNGDLKKIDYLGFPCICEYGKCEKAATGMLFHTPYCNNHMKLRVKKTYHSQETLNESEVE